MKHLDILIPFGLLPLEIANNFIDKYQISSLSSLSILLTKSLIKTQLINPFSRALAHENWVAQTLGLISCNNFFNSKIFSQLNFSYYNNLSIAHMAMYMLGIPILKGYWFLINPVHIHVGSNCLILTDTRKLYLTHQSSFILFKIAESIFSKNGYSIIYGDANNWFIRADNWKKLITATPNAASEQNIKNWIPKGKGHKDWLKLQNEIQMNWFNHKVNIERENIGLKKINSLWLWGGSDFKKSFNIIKNFSNIPIYDSCFNLSGWMKLFNKYLCNNKNNILEKIIQKPGSRALIILDELIEPSILNEWSYWIKCIKKLEKNLFTKLLQKLNNGSLKSLKLILTKRNKITQFNCNRNILRKFWIKPNLKNLL
ncbi:hypothetical protein [Candidatus Profftella armatura]|uniref:Uncharacterized protein n=1 Tax=Candidatus Profftella armatura TaxID=669502 RepID=S5R0H7_9PROT|nr:hypothetical protein [Candidatus Profftella armatura]AGS06712.1 hypothetical protein SSDC_00085 [Candidatus Profftella armatura]ALC95834.1 hypothetical protein AMC77_00085 [Candidatus Profftella armatura]QLK13627.1 hypothetical protein FK495_00080 [Candidatus Profftella armatura]